MKLAVLKSDFVAQIKILRKAVGRSHKGGTVLTIQNGELCIALQGAESLMSAQGEWAGRVLVDSSFILNFAVIPPDVDPVEIEFNDGVLRVGNMKIRAQFSKNTVRKIDLPLNRTASDIWKVWCSYSQTEIEANGLKGEVEKEIEKLASAVATAASALADFGVSKSEIEKMAQESIRNHFEKS